MFLGIFILTADRDNSFVSIHRRYPPPSEHERAIAKRLRQVRNEYHLSRQEIAPHIYLTPDQLNRIERGRVALRFGPAWKFCELTLTSPFWLCFGDPYPRVGIVRAEGFEEEFGERFLSAMLQREDAERIARMSGPRFRSKRLTLFTRSRRKIKMLVEAGVKRYLTSMAAPSLAFTWGELRSRLKNVTRVSGARAELARSLKVSTAAVTQWLTGATAPKADTTLRLLQRVLVAEARLENAERAGARSARKTKINPIRMKKQHRVRRKPK